MSELLDRFNRLRQTYSRLAGYDRDLWEPIGEGIEELEGQGHVANAVLELIAVVEKKKIPPEAILELIKTALRQFTA